MTEGERLGSDYLDSLRYSMQTEVYQRMIQGEWHSAPLQDLGPVEPPPPIKESIMEFKYRWFCDTRRANPTMFGAETIRAVQYIEDLANLSRVNLDSWDLTPFTEPTSEPYAKGIKLDKNKINELFFNEVERRNADPLIPKDVAKKLPTADFEAFKNKQVTKAHLDFIRMGEENMYNAQDFARRTEDSNRKAIDCFNKADALIGRVNDMLEQFNRALKKGNWSFHSLTGNQICFTPSADIWLQYRNVETQEHYRVNFGKMIVKIDPVNAQVRVGPDVGGRSPVSGNHFHPHVNSGGDVCWGEGANEQSGCMAKGNYERLLAILWTIITNYNPKSPYRSLAEFQRCQPENKPGYVPNICKVCSGNQDLHQCVCCMLCLKHPDQCECVTCVACGIRHKVEDPKICSCCTKCNKSSDQCVCCTVCGVTPDFDDERGRHIDLECGCCYHCMNKEGACKCPICEAKGCGQKIYNCGSYCGRCMKAHISDGGYCPRCNRNEWKREMERAGFNVNELLIDLGLIERVVTDGERTRSQAEVEELQPDGGPQASLEQADAPGEEREEEIEF